MACFAAFFILPFRKITMQAVGISMCHWITLSQKMNDIYLNSRFDSFKCVQSRETQFFIKQIQRQYRFKVTFFRKIIQQPVL